MLIRSAPQTSGAVLKAAYRATHDESRIIAAGGSGWQQFHDTPPAARGLRTSSDGGEQEITYELWQF